MTSNIEKIRKYQGELDRLKAKESLQQYRLSNKEKLRNLKSEVRRMKYAKLYAGASAVKSSISRGADILTKFAKSRQMTKPRKRKSSSYASEIMDFGSVGGNWGW